MMEALEYVVLRIIQEQEMLIGPIAWTEAQKVVGLTVHPHIGSVEIVGSNPNAVLSELVDRYSKFFGSAVKEVQKDAEREATSLRQRKLK
jgi:hypothetical protein